MEKRPMCPNCRAFISTADRVCPYCEFELHPKRSDPRRIRLNTSVDWIPQAHFTTIVLLLINAGLYIATALYSVQHSDGGGFWDVDGRTLALFGAKWGPALQAGQWWRLVTAGFLHGGLLHIIMNSWVIFDLGAVVEEFYGTSRYLVIYFLSTIAGFFASAVWSPVLSVGASAGLFGLIGSMIAVGVRSRTPMAEGIRAHFTQWAIWAVVIGFLPMFRADNAAHLGGLAAGFVVGYVADRPLLINSWKERAWKIGAVSAVLLTFLSFALAGLGLTRIVL